MSEKNRALGIWFISLYFIVYGLYALFITSRAIIPVLDKFAILLVVPIINCIFIFSLIVSGICLFRLDKKGHKIAVLAF